MVKSTVEAMRDHYAKHNKHLHWTLPLTTIPLGVDTNLYRPPTGHQRLNMRRRLGIPNDQLAILFVGRLAHHAKAHPFPMFRGAQYVAEKTAQKVHLILCGWFSNAETKQAFIETAAREAPNTQLHIVDGTDDHWRFNIHHASDVFVSLSDNIQETFGLTPLEAMSVGLPVIASDWNGYRDIVQHDVTGFLTPTTMVYGATSDLADRYMHDEINYDRFLGQCNQSVCVATDEFQRQLLQLAQSPELRSRFGEEGRKIASREFDWKRIIQRYEELWDEQEAIMKQMRSSAAIGSSLSPTSTGSSPDIAVPDNNPATFIPLNYYPPIEVCFAGYPSQWLDGTMQLSILETAKTDFNVLIQDRLCNYCLDWLPHAATIRRILASTASNQTLQQFVGQLQSNGIQSSHALQIVAWLCKYDLIRAKTSIEDSSFLASTKRNDVTVQAKQMTFVITCKGRLHELQQTLPHTVKQKNCRVIVVDYDCPENSGEWVQRNFPQVQVIHVRNRPEFFRSEAKNVGGFAVQTDWICFLDADIVLSEDFADSVQEHLLPKTLLRNAEIAEGVGGTFICPTDVFRLCGGHDPVFLGWGEEDDDLLDALRFYGCEQLFFPARFVRHLEHTDDRRMEFHSIKDRSLTHMNNRVYRSLKWDLIRISTKFPPLELRQKWYQKACEAVALCGQQGQSSLEFNLGEMLWKPIDMSCNRSLRYSLNDLRLSPKQTDDGGL